jgi:hypothetical protein
MKTGPHLADASADAAPTDVAIRERAGLLDSPVRGTEDAMAIYSLRKQDGEPRSPTAVRFSALFGGPRARWRPAFDELTAHVHRVQLTDPAQVDDELCRWLRQAKDAAVTR